jgi:DNA-directed RNA polymerase
MDTCELPLEIEKALEKAEKKNERAINTAGFGASDNALVIANRNLRALTDHVKSKISAVDPRSAEAAVTFMLGQLPSETVALVSLQSTLHSVAMGEPTTEMFLSVGHNIAAECWAAGLTRADPKLAARIEREAKTRGNVAYRRRAARSIALKAGYKAKRWSRDRLVHAGTWLVNAACEALPHVFDWAENEARERVLTVTPEALAEAEDAVGEMIRRNPVHLPLTVEPKPWRGWRMDSHDARVAYETTFLRSRYGDVAAAAKASIAAGTMKPALDAVNALQAVPWRINQRVYGVIRACIERGIAVPGLPGTDVSLPEVAKPWGELTDIEQKQWRVKASKAKQRNRALIGERLMLEEDMITAERMAANERFFTPMNCDWRGRVYGLCHFNFQREDRVRSLFEFADGEAIGEEGLWWLKVHVANCGDFDKISKRPLKERVQWVDEEHRACTEGLRRASDEGAWLDEADKPFLFLAACMELTSAVATAYCELRHLACQLRRIMQRPAASRVR